jgi:hypothetical protein
LLKFLGNSTTRETATIKATATIKVTTEMADLVDANNANLDNIALAIDIFSLRNGILSTTETTTATTEYQRLFHSL